MNKKTSVKDPGMCKNCTKITPLDIVVLPYDFWENMKIENSYKATIASVYKGQTSLYTDVKIPMEQPTI